MSPRRARAGGARWRHGAGLAAFPASVLVCAVAACDSPPNCYNINPGDRIAISVLAIDGTPNGTPSACLGLDITPGLTLDATDLTNPSDTDEGGDCNAAVVGIAPFAGWTWTPASPQAGTAVLQGSFNASNGTCAGDVQINVTVPPNDSPFAVSEAGQSPNVVMERLFFLRGDGGADCPQSCDDRYFVNLQRL